MPMPPAQAIARLADALLDADEDLREAVAVLLDLHSPEDPLRAEFPR